MAKSKAAHVIEGQTSKRDPERTQGRILEAAFKEFAAKGFAGARVDAIARRAQINKRMLYHYFGDKEALFRSVLRRKISEREAWGELTPDDPSESLPYWFRLAFGDADWVRLLEWEALQFGEKPLIEEKKRSQSVATALKALSARQKSGAVTDEFNIREMLLAMVCLTWFPVAFPQLTRLITGERVSTPKFQASYALFLKKMGMAFQRAGVDSAAGTDVMRATAI